MTANVLRYSIRDESLCGTVASISFSMRAFSGGGRGSTSGMQRADLRHWNTAKKAPVVFDKANRGGPIPLGWYLATYFGHHPHLGLCAQLDQTMSSLIQRDYNSPIGLSFAARSGFYIHGEGPKGSDGCIVPAIKDDLHKLLKAIKSAGGPVVLIVHSEGVNADKFEASSFSANVA